MSDEKYICKKCDKFLGFDELECVGAELKGLNFDNTQIAGSVYVHKNCNGKVEKIIEDKIVNNLVNEKTCPKCYSHNIISNGVVISDFSMIPLSGKISDFTNGRMHYSCNDCEEYF